MLTYFTPQPIDEKRYQLLCGPLDSHLHLIQQSLNVRIKHSGNKISVSGGREESQAALKCLTNVYQQTNDGVLKPEDVRLCILEIENSELLNPSTYDPQSEAQLQESLTPPPNPDPNSIDTRYSKVPVGRKDNLNYQSHNTPKTQSIKQDSWDTNDRQPITIQTPNLSVRSRSAEQQLLFQSINNNSLTIALGPAGTGKTWLSTACALSMLQSGTVDRFVLVRPALEAGEKLGYLPGDANEKVEPYQRPIIDALEDFCGADQVRALIDQNRIEIAPFAYMRGRTIANSFILVDEAQNTTLKQMELVLTRLGFGSKMVICGDPDQSDLSPENQGALSVIARKLQGLSDVGIVRLDASSIFRHKLVSQILSRLEKD